MTWCKSSLAEHGETGGAVPGGAVVPDPSHMLGFISGVDTPGLQEEHHILNLFDHSAIGKLQVILWVSVTTAWSTRKTVIQLSVYRPAAFKPQPVTLKMLTGKMVDGDCGDSENVNTFD